jgi:Mg2+/Co2+ transporter CorB
MAYRLEEIVEKLKRVELISKRTKLALAGFDLAVQCDDSTKQEELRTEVHQLIDDQLDLQLEMKRLKDILDKERMDRFNNLGD